MYPFIVDHLGLTFTEGTHAPTSSNSTTPEVAPGSIATIRMYDRAASFVYVQAGEAVAAGQILTLGLNHDDADVDATQATTTYNMTGTGDFTADEFNGMGGMAVINAGGGLKFGGHYIRRNSANILYTDRVWGEALTTASDYLTHKLNKVMLAVNSGVPTHHVCGVAVSAITSSSYAWVQISGVHWKVRTDGSTDTLAGIIGEGVMASATAGAACGWTNAGTAAEDVYFTFGMALCSDAEGDTAGEGIPVLIQNCAKFWI